MDDLLKALNAIVPERYQVAVLMAANLLALTGRIYSAIRSRGGLRGLYRGLVLGEGVPLVISEDYRAELKIPPKTPEPVKPEPTRP